MATQPLTETGEHVFGTQLVGVTLDDRGRTLTQNFGDGRGLLGDGVFVFFLTTAGGGGGGGAANQGKIWSPALISHPALLT